MKHSARPLLRHLTVVIAVKLAVLSALWFAFFSGPHPAPDAAQVAEHLGGSPATTVTLPSTPR